VTPGGLKVGSVEPSSRGKPNGKKKQKKSRPHRRNQQSRDQQEELGDRMKKPDVPWYEKPSSPSSVSRMVQKLRGHFPAAFCWLPKPLMIDISTI
jgi:hypothetical protein